MLKRPLVLSAVLFAVGILANIFDIGIWYVAVFLTAAVLLEFAITRGRSLFCMAAAVFIVLGFFRMELAQNQRDKVLVKYAGQKRTMELVVTEFSDANNVIAQFCDENKTHKVNLYVGKPKSLYPGDIIQGEINLREPARMKSSSACYATYLSGRGINLKGSCKEVEITGRVKGGVMGKIYSLRRQMDSIGKMRLCPQTRMLYNAMVFGDKRLISGKLSNDLQSAGLNHIAVVSGMHLSVIIAVWMFFMVKLFGKRRIGNVLAIIGALLVTFITGGGASVVRAFIMCLVYQLSRILYRENDALTSLGTAAFIMLLINPYVIFNAGFVMSLLSVLGIILYSKKLTNAFCKILPLWAASAIGVSISAQLLVTVAVICYFKIVTPYAVLSNLLVAFVVTPFTVMGMAAPIFENINFLSDILFWAMDFMSDIIQSVCHAVASFPMAVVSVGKITIHAVLLWILLLVLIYIYPSTTKKYLSTAAFFLAASLGVFILGQSSVMDMRFLTYAGEKATAIAFDSGDALLIDCPDYMDALTLEENSNGTFRWGILSSDNLGQMHTLARKGNMQALIIHRDMYTEKMHKALKDINLNKKLRIILLESGQQLSLNQARISFEKSAAAEKVFVKVDYGQKSFVSLQSFLVSDVENMLKKGETLPSDATLVPFGAKHKYTDLRALTSGKIIEREKSYSLK